MQVRSAIAALAACLLAGSAGAAGLTTDHGSPVGSNQDSKTAGPGGGVLLEDFHLIQKLARFDRERIPERVVHARGIGAHGVFESAGDFSEITKVSMLAAEGKRTPVFVRFSTVVHSKGSPETLRDPRGFALKFYTDEGNWDLVGNNLPVFFIRDAIKFPDMVHSLKPDPVTNKQDPNRFFDFFSHVPEATHMLTQLYSDLGVPANYRQMDGFGVHAFKFVNARGEVRYVKFNWKSEQGIATLDAEEAAEVASRDHQHATVDLYDAIRAENYPSWTLEAQVIAADELDGFAFDPLDATKIWPESEVPSVVLGRFTLNRVPENFFQFSEQSAFSPAVQPPGVEPSEDRLLQGRLFSYADTQRYRIGANYLDLPVNRPQAQVASNNQDGALNHSVRSGSVNYEPSLNSPLAENPRHRYGQTPVQGLTQQQRIAKERNYAQAGVLYRSMDRGARKRLVASIAGDLGQVENRLIRERIVGYLLKADRDYGRAVAKRVGVDPDAAELAATEVERARADAARLAQHR
ncbi:MAG: catalase [Myxococcota bacterium]